MSELGRFPERKSIRLPGYDYSQAGAYFVTIVSRDRELTFLDGRLRLLAEEAWRWLADQYPYVDLGEFIVMPNHLHGIVIIDDDARAAHEPPLRSVKPLGGLIGAFKTVSTKRINLLRGTPGQAIWQRNYYEHIIRNEEEYGRIAEYIAQNPAMWNEDPENPDFGENQTGTS
jgi:REP element-mobilizing transposase RayT